MRPGFVKDQIARLKAFYRSAKVGHSSVSRLVQSSGCDLDTMSLRRLASTIVSRSRQWLAHVSTGYPAFKPRPNRAIVGITTPVRNSVIPPPSSSSSSWTLLSVSPSSSSLSRWTSQARAAFVNGLVRSALAAEGQGRVALSREARKTVARRLLQSHSAEEGASGASKTRSPPCNHAPFLGLVGLGLASNESGIILTEEEEYDGLCSKFRDIVGRLAWVWDVNRGGFATEMERFRSGNVELHASDLTFGPLLGKGANAAVHAAGWANPDALFLETNAVPADGIDCEGGQGQEPELKRMRKGSMSLTTGARGMSLETPVTSLVGKEEHPLAVKIMFNYDVMSDVGVIMRAMRKEIVPCLSVCLQGEFAKDSWLRAAGNLPPHPNVALCFQAFVDRIDVVSRLPGSVENYGAALPPRLHSSGLGRNMSLFLVMKRYDVTLERYLTVAGDRLPMKSRESILTQILEGVTHLVSHGIAHRDLKTDNVLVNFNDDGFRHPHVVLSDFGCCLDDPGLNLKLPFTTEDTSRGGNSALMAPEVIKAVPGMLTRIDYSKADVWAVGAIAYEIFGEKNPFYGEPRVYSGSYKKEDLPALPRGVEAVVQRLVSALLAVDPRERLSAAVAANVCQLLLWGPRSWITGRADGEMPALSDIMNWVLNLTTKVIWEAREGDLDSEVENGSRLDFQLATTFLSRMDFSDIKAAVEFICRS